MGAAGRIFLLVTNLTFGGAEAQVARLAYELKTRNWDVTVVSMMVPDALVEGIEKNGIPVYNLGMNRGIPDPRALLRLRRLIKKFKPQIVHCHMFHANMLGRIARLIAPIPVLISTIHNLRETSERGGPTWYKEKLYRLTDGLGDVTTIICQSAFDRHVAVGAVPAKRMRMIPNFVDTDRFSPRPDDRPANRAALGIHDEFVWLAVGRLVAQKDYPNLMRAFAKIRQQDPQRKILVLVAGGGPLETQLKQEAHAMGLDSVIRFLGTNEDIVNLYNAADAYVMSSEFEGLSVALLEANAMALPSVVTDAGGNAEIIHHEKTGFVVPCSNEEALSASIQKLMNMSDADRLAMGSQASADCKRRYHKSAVMKEILALYAEFLHQDN